MPNDVEVLKEAIRKVKAQFDAMKRHGMHAVDGGGEQPTSKSAPQLRVVKTEQGES